MIEINGSSKSVMENLVRSQAQNTLLLQKKSAYSVRISRFAVILGEVVRCFIRRKYWKLLFDHLSSSSLRRTAAAERQSREEEQRIVERGGGAGAGGVDLEGGRRGFPARGAAPPGQTLRNGDFYFPERRTEVDVDLDEEQHFHRSNHPAQVLSSSVSPDDVDRRHQHPASASKESWDFRTQLGHYNHRESSAAFATSATRSGHQYPYPQGIEVRGPAPQVEVPSASSSSNRPNQPFSATIAGPSFTSSSHTQDPLRVAAEREDHLSSRLHHRGHNNGLYGPGPGSLPNHDNQQHGASFSTRPAVGPPSRVLSVHHSAPAVHELSDTFSRPKIVSQLRSHVSMSEAMPTSASASLKLSAGVDQSNHPLCLSSKSTALGSISAAGSGTGKSAHKWDVSEKPHLPSSTTYGQNVDGEENTGRTFMAAISSFSSSNMAAGGSGFGRSTNGRSHMLSKPTGVSASASKEYLQPSNHVHRSALRRIQSELVESTATASKSSTTFTSSKKYAGSAFMTPAPTVPSTANNRRPGAFSSDAIYGGQKNFTASIFSTPSAGAASTGGTGSCSSASASASGNKLKPHRTKSDFYSCTTARTNRDVAPGGKNSSTTMSAFRGTSSGHTSTRTQQFSRLGPW